MPAARRLPLPPRIAAVSRLDWIEELADAFERENGFKPELLSHWDPKAIFETEISRWLSNQRPLGSLVPYVFSSYLLIDKKLRERLFLSNGRDLVMTGSGTTALATVMTYLANVEVECLHIVTPSYFAVEALARTFGIAVTFHHTRRVDGSYILPSLLHAACPTAVWLTSPVYGASAYVSADVMTSFVDKLPPTTIVVIDESLGYPDRTQINAMKSRDRVIRIATPHKALCVNGEKVSFIDIPVHLVDSFNTWSECLTGGIGASGLRALDFLLSEAFPVAVERSRALNGELLARLMRIVGHRPNVSFDKNTDGHFVMLYWPNLPMRLGRDSSFVKRITAASGASFIPASRNRHSSRMGFGFRVNLLRLDDAGLGALKRLADELDHGVEEHARPIGPSRL